MYEDSWIGTFFYLHSLPPPPCGRLSFLVFVVGTIEVASEWSKMRVWMGGGGGVNVSCLLKFWPFLS